MASHTYPIRWIEPRHYPAVSAIDYQAYDSPWSAREFKSCLQQLTTAGQIAQANGMIAGYLVYDVVKQRYRRILRIAVDPAFRRLGIGRALLRALSTRSSKHVSVVIDVDETNLDAQLFFRACGFLATGIVRTSGGTVAYRMELRFVRARRFLILPA